jgi:hypothetical protein
MVKAGGTSKHARKKRSERDQEEQMEPAVESVVRNDAYEPNRGKRDCSESCFHIIFWQRKE